MNVFIAMTFDIFHVLVPDIDRTIRRTCRHACVMFSYSRRSEAVGIRQQRRWDSNMAVTFASARVYQGTPGHTCISNPILHPCRRDACLYYTYWTRLWSETWEFFTWRFPRSAINYSPYVIYLYTLYGAAEKGYLHVTEMQYEMASLDGVGSILRNWWLCGTGHSSKLL